jgi:branched-chain amino acid transport system ATP-binding protein
MLEVYKIRKSFNGFTAVDGVSFAVPARGITAVIGPNGAGKSTLVKALFGLIPVREGKVSLRGDDVTGLPAHELVRRGIGYVPQLSNVFPRLTVQENLRMGVYLSPGRFAQRLDVVTELFPRLAEHRSTRAGSLSGGERQMLAMARALMPDPSVLLLDEPSAGLAPMLQDQVFDWIERVNRAGVSIVMVEQNARRCLQICHRGYVLDQGRNAYTAPGHELLHDPKVVELYLGALARAR